jgi:hypothetical protein
VTGEWGQENKQPEASAMDVFLPSFPYRNVDVFILLSPFFCQLSADFVAIETVKQVGY